MWVPSAVIEWFGIAKDTVDSLREDLAATRAERDALKFQLISVQTNFEWLRVKVNALELERAQLIKRAYNIDVPVPEIARTQNAVRPEITPDIFNDIGDDAAKQLGLPIYSN